MEATNGNAAPAPAVVADQVPADPPPQIPAESGNGFVWPPDKNRADEPPAANGEASSETPETAAGAAAAAQAPALSEKDRLVIEKKRLRNKMNAQNQRNKTRATMEQNRKLIEEMRAQEAELDAALEEYRQKLAKYEQL